MNGQRVGWMATTIVALVCAVPALADGPSPQEVKKAGRLYQKGARSLQTGSVEQAEQLFREALTVVPALPEAHIGLGHIYVQRSDFKNALQEYSLARDGYAEIGSALLDIQSKRYNDTASQISDLQDSINQITSTSNPSPQVSLQVSRLQNTIAQLEAVQPPDKDNVGRPPAEVFFYIGNAQFRLGQLDEAVGSWEQCAELNPKYAMVFNNLALGYWQQGKLAEARSSLTTAEELGFPVNPQFKLDLEQAEN